MTKQKKELKDNVIVDTYFENNARVTDTFKALRSKGYTFRNAEMRVRLRSLIQKHLDKLEEEEVGTYDPKEAVKLKDGNYFLTSAQNNTKVHEELFKTILNFCDITKSKLLISKFTYKRKGFENMSSELADNLWYDHKLLPYLMNEQVLLGDFIFYGDFDILPTAVTPLSGLESHSGEKDCGFPHVKLQMRPVSTMPDKPAKHIYTTGTCTLLNYVARKAGQKAELHHVFGGLFVQIKDGKAEVTPIVADAKTGSFNLYDTKYTSKGKAKEPVFAVNFGDIHLEKLTHSYYEGMQKVMNDLSPKHVFFHDVLDFEARNHHEVKDKFSRYAKFVQRKDIVQNNVLDLLKWLNDVASDYKNTTFHVVPSNHNDAFYKWANADQPSNDYPNLQFWHFVNYVMLKEIERGNYQELLPLIAKELNKPIKPNVVFHEREESVRFFDIEYNMHGDIGSNGSRGSPQGLSKLGFKANTGHTHSAGIYNGVYVAGVSGTLDHKYNKGLSSWSNSFVLTYNSGKRTIITQYP